MNKPLILVLCTGNSCRSHMAHGVLENALGDIAEIRSAGTRPAGYVHPKAIEVMREVGIDISSHQSRNLSEYLHSGARTVITVCGGANEDCPVFPGKVRRMHIGFDDPAKAMGSEEEVLSEFRRVRDEIRTVFGAFADGYRHGREDAAI
ncbi:MAG: arsenate reductase ArsC [Opitutales bacterium]|nr:arsenate reductase ArsC [Opitutales bacterium]